MDFYILIFPRDRQYIVFGALLYLFLCLFSVSFIHYYRKKKHHHHWKKSLRNCFLCRFPSLRILLRLISENTEELDKNCSTVQNPCFDQNLEACRNFGIVQKSLCYEAMNEAIFEWQAIKDVFQNKLFLEFLEVSWSKTSVYSKTINVFHLSKSQLN